MLGTAGNPILYMHGTPESCLTIDFQSSAPVGADAVLFSFDRPGYGLSDFAPFDFESVAEDAAAAADQFGFDRFAVIGHSGGGPFALAIASYLGDRVRSVGVSASPVPYPLVPRAWERLSDIDRQASDVASRDRVEAARLFAVDFEPMAMTLRAGLEEVVAYLNEEMRGDASVLAQPSVATTFARSLQEGVRQGVEGCAWDNVAWVPNWSFDLSTVRQPVHLWYGARDELMPPFYGEWLQQKLPNSEFTTWSDCAHLGLFSHWQDVIQALVNW